MMLTKNPTNFSGGSINRKIVCYYHEDMDGIASASIIKDIYPNAKFIGVNYGDDWDVNDVIDSYCIVVDFSFTNMEELNQYPDRLCWIDHHKTAMEQNKALWEDTSIDGLRDLTKAGCELTWEYFHTDAQIPRAIELIADRDIWKFVFGDDSRAFHEYATMKFKNPFVGLLTPMKNVVKEWVQIGYILLEKKKEQVRQSYEDGVDIIFHNHKTRTINTNLNVSDTGEMCYKNGYAIALIWSIRNGKVVCSLRSNCIDVSAIAKEYDGGGHKYASGFTVSFDKLGLILEQTCFIKSDILSKETKL